MVYFMWAYVDYMYVFDLLSPTESVRVVKDGDVSTDGPGDQPHQGNGDGVRSRLCLCSI